MSRAEFLSKAIVGGLIDMETLPPQRQHMMLVEIEKELLLKHPFDGLEETAAGLGLTAKRQVTELRSNIYRVFGLPKKLQTQTHAFLIAKRDGVI
jgi:hypothetical protein